MSTMVAVVLVVGLVEAREVVVSTVVVVVGLLVVGFIVA